MQKVTTFPLAMWGVLFILLGYVTYLCGLLISALRIFPLEDDLLRKLAQETIWYSGLPTTIGVVFFALDLAFVFPRKRRLARRIQTSGTKIGGITAVLTAYNDELSIGGVVKDFQDHPLVKRVLVISNNSIDATFENAEKAGALVFNETKQGYGECVYRCLTEATRFEDTDYIVLCEGDGTFRAQDIDKLAAYMMHADIVNGTRIVEQLRAPKTQLSTFVYYGNFFAGKLLELRHLGKGTFTDVGTTYKMAKRETFLALLPKLDPRINLEFNAHFLDIALANNVSIVECPITFHPRIGYSKGGNASNLRALKVGLRMISGLTLGWRLLRS